MAVITISRQSGSEGNEIAQILCEKLGYRLFDKAMMIELADELGSDPSSMTDAPSGPDKARELVDRVLNSFQSPVGRHVFKDISFEEGSAMTEVQVRSLILAAYFHGNVVIVGRGSQIVLSDKPDVLHVRVVAPLDKRIKIWQERESLSYKDANKRVSERDRVHVDFVKNYFDTDIREPSLYDLVVNTSKFPPGTAADLIMEALRHVEPPG